MDDRTQVGTNTVSGEMALRGLYEQPMELAILKQLDRLDAHCRNFLAHSPFAVIGSTRPGRRTRWTFWPSAPGRRERAPRPKRQANACEENSEAAPCEG